MQDQYDLQAIRELLAAAFSAGDIDTLAFDLFRTVKDDFTPGMTRSQKIEMILEYADRYALLPNLFDYTKRHNAYQYGRFAHRLQPLPQAPPADPPPDHRAQRLADIQQHLERNRLLLNQYQVQLDTEDDPRRILRIQQEIERQKETLARYQQEAAALGVSPGQPQPAAADAGSQAVQHSLDAMSHKLDDLSRQVAGAEKRLAAGQ